MIFPSYKFRYDTEVVGEVTDGPEVTLKFHCTTSVPEENTRKRATQSIALPIRISLEHILVEGTKITVYKKKTVSEANTTDLILTVVDCDIFIHDIL